MKNFKKVLALVLVLATLMGLATVAGAAYKDADKIDADYTEAVKVLELIETMEGYPDGTFGPKKTITREEAAKLIAIFDNKDSDISTYYTSINPFADEKGRWGESYVGYGYRAGIIAGMNATTFAPTANVTGTQFLKMALVTLGYDQEVEGFVGASWAVNVLSLAKKLGLIDDLADGWKPEADLTREEAAQILLNTLKCDTVEYAQEAKSANFKPVTSGDTWIFNGKIYLTVAGAVKTGKKLYKDFDLKVETSFDAFERPCTKWTKDQDSVEVMKAPKATFTTEFSACDLLVALGVDKKDQDTNIVVDYVFCDGKYASGSALLNGNGDDYTLDEAFEVDYNGKSYTSIDKANGWGIWHHENANCEDPSDAKWGAQGTLTQVFYNGKDSEGNKHYTVTSIETWLGKVTKATSKTTARDDHMKGSDAVKIEAFLDNLQSNKWNGHAPEGVGYCNGETTGHCDDLKTADYTTEDNGVYTVSYDDPTGLAEKDYVLFTYSFKQTSKSKDEGVQSVDVVEGKEGRLNGYKTATQAKFPTETRINGEYVKDSVHFHKGFDLSKTNNYGTYTFYYDAYGNVIGMTDGSDTSNWGVVDGAYITYNKGTAVLNVEVVGLDAKISEGTAKKMFDAEKFDDLTAADIISDALLNGEYAVDGENRKAFSPAYDHLLKISTDSKGEYTIEYDEDAKPVATGSYDEIKVVKGKPYVEVDGVEVKTLTSDTKILVHKMDGSYVSYTGYKNMESMVAHYAECVMDDDNEFVDVLYLCDDVYMTDGKVTAYVGKGADFENIESKDDGDTYYGLQIFVKGEETTVYVDADTMNALFNEKNGKFVKGFYEFQYVDIDEFTTVVVTKKPAGDDFDDYMNAPVTVTKFNGTVVTVDGGSYALADDCALYAIYKNKVVKSDVDEMKDNYTDHQFYVSFNDDDQVDALYIVLTDND